VWGATATPSRTTMEQQIIFLQVHLWAMRNYAKATECFCWNDLSEVNTKRTEKNVDYSGFRCNCLEIDVLEGYYQ